MNIFVSDADPTIAAQNLDDKRLVKMVLETAQIISAVAHRYGVAGDWYKLTHRNHPCTLWAGDSAVNYEWLYDHGLALAAEYTHRFNKEHKSLAIIKRGEVLLSLDYGLQVTGTPYANCTTYKDMPVIDAYRKYLGDKWDADNTKPKKPLLSLPWKKRKHRPPKWTNRNPPTWYKGKAHDAKQR